MTEALVMAPRPAIAGPAYYLVHGVLVEVTSDVPAARAGVFRSYGAFKIPGDPDPTASARFAVARVSARVDGQRFRLIDHRGQSALVATTTDATIGLLDRVVQAVLDRLATLGVIGTHAGVVEFGERAVLLAGRSGSGKSTLTLGLVRRGAGWLTDELALIAPDDRTVLPYPRALHVSPETLALLPELAHLQDRPRYDLGGGSEWSVTPEDVAIALQARLSGPAPLALIVLLDGDPDPRRDPDIRPVSPALATMELLRGTPAAAEDFERTMRRLTAIAERVSCVRLRVGELDRSALAVREHLRSLA